MAERFRYVHVPEYSTVTSDLSQSSQSLADEIANTREAKDLHDEKYQNIEKAWKLIDSISADIKVLAKMFPIKGKIKHPATTKKGKAKQAEKAMKSYASDEEKAMVERSHRALKNLQSNLSELKSELRKA